MPKKCIICDSGADLMVKGTSDFYCRPCAEDQFGDIAVLVSVEEDARQLKEQVDDIISQADDVLKAHEDD